MKKSSYNIIIKSDVVPRPSGRERGAFQVVGRAPVQNGAGVY
jgi:hypothetical protein